MATYEEKPRTVDAWKVGSSPVDQWVQDLLGIGKAKNKRTPDGREYVRVDIDGTKLLAEKGDYLIKTVAAAGNVVYMTMASETFERLYQRTGGGGK